jgi:hypothetical protein
MEKQRPTNVSVAIVRRKFTILRFSNRISGATWRDFAKEIIYENYFF